MNPARHQRLILACALALAVTACVSQPLVIPPGLSVGEIFQRAQDAASRGDYTTAIAYYSVVPKDFPDDKEHNAWASYEIACLYHQMGKNDVAVPLFRQLLAQYDSAAADSLPPAPKVLAQKVLAGIQAGVPTGVQPGAEPPAPTPSAPAGTQAGGGTSG